jgi:anti-sigma regulatory factor (Ser/Thr protein kinase)
MIAKFDFALTNPEEDHAVLLQAVEEFADALGLQPSLRYRLGLVVDELVSNCIVHGARPGEDRGIRVGITDGGEDITVEIVDSGPPFDPTVHANRKCLHEGDVRIGGMGLCLVRNLASGMGYVRQDGMNRTRVTLAKNIQENTCTSTK